MDLKQKMIKGLFFAGLTSLFVRILSFIVTLWLSRLLFPQDFGLFGLGLLVIGIFGIFQDLGLPSALIYQEKKQEESASTAFFTLLVFGAILTIACYFSAPLFCTFFKEKVVLDILKVLSLTIMISSAGKVYISLLNKRMEFEKLLLPEVFSIAVYGFITVALAYMGCGFWSMVWGYFCQIAVNSVLSWWACKWSPRMIFDFGALLDMLAYGKEVVFTSLLLYFSLQTDKIFIGHLIDATSLGFYAVACNITSVPAIGISQIISKVAFPLFSRLQNEKENLKKSFEEMFTLNALLTVPLCAGLFLLGEDLIRVVLSDKWLPMLNVLRILCLFGVLRSFGAILGSFLNSIGKPNLLKNLVIVHLLVMGATIYPFIKFYGILGVACSMTLGQIVCFIYGIYKLSNYVEFNPLDIIKFIWAPVCGSLVIAFVVIALKFTVLASINLINFIVIVVLATMAYLIIIWFMKKAWIMDIWDSIKEIGK